MNRILRKDFVCHSQSVRIYTDFIVKICITIHGYDDVYVVVYDH